MKNVFVETKNVTAFIAAMREAQKAAGEPVLLAFHGQAGRGKTTAARYFAAQEGWTYARALKGWTELWMLQDLCFELRVDPIPYRKKAAFEAIRDRLLDRPEPVIIDEADRLSESHLEWIRDLADLTTVPFALVGEKLLMHKMERQRRIWSRTLRAVEFGPISASDALFYAKKSGDMALSGGQAEILRKASDGDFRLLARDLRALEELIQANRQDRITDEMVRAAIKRGLRGA